MNSYRLKIADHILEVVMPFRTSRRNLVEFLSNDQPEIQIVFGDEIIIDKESVYGEKDDLLGWQGNVDISALLQRIADEYIDFDTLLMHGAAIAYENQAYIFTAPSGTGKTTHIAKWLDNCSDAFVINGDKPFIKFSDNGRPLVYGSPWAGKENEFANTMVSLKAIIFLERNEDNSIYKISFAEAFPVLLKQIYRPANEEKMRKTLKLIQKLNTGVSFWHFNCNNFKDDCFAVAYNALVCVDKKGDN